VQRVAAILLLVLFSFSLIAQSLRGDGAPNLPECCRKAGKHHCASMAAAAHEEGSGATFKSTVSKCPLFSVGSTAPLSGKAGTPKAASAVLASLSSQPRSVAQTEARYRISFDRAGQKRGPPSLLS